MLKINGLTTGYNIGKKTGMVLQENMTAVVKTGQLICVLGPNGAGKSTLLKTLSGFLKPLSGKILYDDKPIDKLDLKTLARLVSVVLTDRFSDLYLTAFDVVRMGRFPYVSFLGKMRPSDVDFIHEIMEKLGVFSLKRKPFYNLSDGERQKVLIARALVQDTPYLMLDEPVAFIDSPGKIEIMELLTSLAHDQGKAVIMTTHDMDTGLRYADSLWLIHRKKPLLTGIPEDMVLQGRVGEYFQRSGLLFDREKGIFRSSRKTGKDRGIVFVRLMGRETQWLAKALERSGFVVKAAHDLPKKGYFAFFEGGIFYLLQNGCKPEEFSDIASLLSVLLKRFDA